MRQNGTINPKQPKIMAKRKYAERQVEKFVKWSIQNKGKVKWNELMGIIDNLK
jgi:hypothetical protein